MAIAGAINIVLSLIFIALSFWTLQTFRFDVLLSNPKGPQAKLLQIFLSIVIGHSVSTFFSDYFGWTRMLQGFF